MKRKLLSSAVVILASVGLIACQGASQAHNPDGITTNAPVPGQPKIGNDIYQALSMLPQARITGVGVGGVPSFIRGQLSRLQLGPEVTAADLQGALHQIAPVFRLNADNLQLKKLTRDDLGFTHARFVQTKQGLPVVGGELDLHVNRTGVVFAANGSARDGISISATPTVDASAAVQAARQARTVNDQSVGQARLVYVIVSSDRSMHLAWEVPVLGVENGIPVHDLLYVDAHTGQVVDNHPQIETALSRKVYSANNGTSLPGTLKRSEGQAANSDAQVNFAYDNTGATYNAYKALYNRDSYDDNGAQLISSVHYDQSYDNAYWDGTQMVYGDGDGSEMTPLAEALDVTAHELTHAVTGSTSNLNYQDESGAMNEAMSDILGGAVVESWQRANAAGSTDIKTGVTADTWKIGEVIWTPNTPGDALRYMNDPASDGSSSDYYPDRYTGSQDNGGVHWNSGIANLAFYLLSQGGTHPENKTSVQVPGIGIDKAAQIFYRADTHYLTSTSQFADLRTATAQAAQDLYGTTEVNAVQAAWDAVGVPGGDGGGGTGGGGGGATALTNGQAATGLSATSGNGLYFTLAVPSGASNLKFVISGSSGDADLYVKFGSTPTTSSYDCRPYLTGDNESCAISNVQSGTYYVMVNAYQSFSGVSLTGSFDTGSTQSNDFSISLSPTSVSLAQGGSATVTVNTAVTSGSAESVSLSVSSLPSGVTGTFSPSSVTSGQSATLTLHASSSAAAVSGDSFTVKGTASTGSHSKSGSVTVTSSGGGGGGTGVLQNGVAVAVPNTSTGQHVDYTLSVPSGATGLSFSISGSGSGDADLYVKFGSAPTTSSYDCRPYQTGSNETCTISNVQAGTYYVMVNAYQSFTGVSVKGTYSTDGGGGGGGTGVLQNGVSVTVPNTSSGQHVNYTLSVPSGSTSLTIAISGGTSGDADLYVKFGSAPTTSSYDCRPYLTGSNETCTISNVQAGTYYVMVNAYQSFSGVSLKGTYGTGGTGGGGGGGTGNVLQNGVPVSVSASAGSSKSFTYASTGGTVHVAISGNSGDADLYVKVNGTASTSNYDCRPYLYGSNESCDVPTQSGDTVSVMVNAYQTFSGISLVASN